MPPRPTARRSLLLAILSCSLATTWSSAAVTPNGRLQIIHMDVGQGDGTVLITPLGQVVLIDDGAYTNTGAPVAQLAALGVDHVTLHFASHYHADHIGVISQIAASGVTIDAGWDRAESYSSGSYTNYVNTLAGGKRHTLVKNQVFTLDSLSAHPVTIKCVDLAGAGISTTDENSRSVVLKVSYGEFDEVFGGDLVGIANGIATNIETTVGPEVGPVEVYKVHHHGSRFSSNDAWLTATAPKIGVIQVGNGNSYGHPTADALTRLHNHGVHTYWNETGAGAAPNPAWDRVAGGQVIIQATWQPAGVDTVRGPGFADTFTNSGTAVDGTPPIVSVVAPNGGEVLPTGSSGAINWSASDNIGVTGIDLDYSLDNGANWSPIASGIGNSGSYAWIVPNAPSTQVRVRATAHDLAGNSATDASNASLAIADQLAPTVHVVTPNGGDVWDESSTQRIRWTSADNIGVDSVNVDYSRTGATGPWLAIVHGLAASDSVMWTLPAGGSDSALVRVTAFDHALNQAADASDGLFQIRPLGPLGVPATATALEFAAPEPNPSQDRVTFRFSLPIAADARVELVDVMGRRVWAWSGAGLSAGPHAVEWDGRLDSGQRPGVGLYWVRLAGSFGTRTVKVVRLN